jgi:inward rectifier potassium channel
MLIAPYRDGTSVQFRIANGRKNELMELEARVLFMTVQQKDGALKRDYADLELERRKVYFLPLSWTIVHPIDESSPLYGKTAEDLARLEAEFLILIRAFDDTFSQTVHARYSYTHEELTWNARFVRPFHIDERGDMVLEIGKLSQFERA